MVVVALLATALAAVAHAEGPEASEFELVAHLRHRGLAELEQRFWAVSDPAGPNYLQHLALEEVAGIIGATDPELKAVQSWLLSLGGRPSSLRTSPLGDTVSVALSATAEPLQGSLRDLAKGKPSAVEFLLRRDRRSEASTDVERQRPPKTGANSGYTISNIKQAYGMPTDLQANASARTLQMVWGPGTFGYSRLELSLHKATQCPLLDLSKIKFDTENHGVTGGDNFMEGNLDTKMIASFGLNVETLVSNTNTSASTEEGNGFGQALLDFVTELAARQRLPHVLSMSLGSLAARSCDLLCSEVAKLGHSLQECQDFLQQQRQVCMFLSQAQVERINTAFQILGVRGVSVFGSSGDGGSHFSFERFKGAAIADSLNEVSCKLQMPVFPTASPYIVSVGGSMWKHDDPASPVTWSTPGGGSGSGGGFSWQFGAPAHQRGAVDGYLNGTAQLPPADSFNRNGRAYPDISAVGVDGTSQSCPIMAGLFAMLIDHRLSAGLPPLGFVAPRIWQVAQRFPGEAFQDIVEGNSKTSCENGFPSSKGWDPNTGWGRPVWAGMLRHFASDEQRPGQRSRLVVV